tara:strand:- start:1950 stop:2399 length:450 start_codon:yes stop_codon:yes gene_type:complete
MAVYRNRAGLFSVGSYQVSGYPFITGSTVTQGGPSNGEVRVEFPTVAKNTTIINTTQGVGLRIYFNAAVASNGVNGAGAYPDDAPIDGLHFITLENKKDSVTFDVKCREIFVALTSSAAGIDGSFQCWAELTGIPANEMFKLTGSGLTD